MIAIIDYGLGNIKSFYNIYKENGISIKVIKNYRELNSNIEKLILPGIGSFDNAISLLKKNNFFDEIINFASNDNKKILGICVGMQILSAASDEGNLSGLNFFKERFTKLDNVITPHVGWNNIEIVKNSPLFTNIPDKTFFYFLHSYCLKKFNPSYIICNTEYNQKFISVFEINNIYGIQFHPEKSHNQGEKLLINFYKI